MSSFATRLEHFWKTKGFKTQKEFASSCGITEKNITSWKSGSSPTSKLLSKITNKYPLLNTNWLSTGEGEMEIKPISQTTDIFKDKYIVSIEENSERMKEEISKLKADNSEIRRLYEELIRKISDKL